MLLSTIVYKNFLFAVFDLITRMLEDEKHPPGVIDNSSKNPIGSKLEQFQKLGDVIEKHDETGLMQVESFCMNCHENVPFLLASMPRIDSNYQPREQQACFSFAYPSSVMSSLSLLSVHTVLTKTIP
jgi:hypothetical protein